MLLSPLAGPQARESGSMNTAMTTLAMSASLSRSTRSEPYNLAEHTVVNPLTGTRSLIRPLLLSTATLPQHRQILQARMDLELNKGLLGQQPSITSSIAHANTTDLQAHPENPATASLQPGLAPATAM